MHEYVWCLALACLRMYECARSLYETSTTPTFIHTQTCKGQAPPIFTHTFTHTHVHTRGFCIFVRSSVLECFKECCRVLQSVAECCRVLQSVAECCRVLQSVAECCIVLQYVIVRGCRYRLSNTVINSVLQCDVV